MSVLPELRVVPRLVPGSVEHRTQPYVSASVAGCLFGCHPFVDLPRLAAIRRGEVEDDAGEAADTGNVLEDVVAQHWAAKHGVTVYHPAATYVAGPISANPDRLIDGCTDTILQIKTTSKPEGPLPAHIWWQEQAELLTTGAQQAVVYFLFGGSLCFREFVVQRDDAAMGELVAAAENFLAALDMGIDPAPVHRDPLAETVQVGEREVDWLRDLAFYRKAEKDAGAEAKRLRGLIDAAVGGPGMAVGSKAVLVDGEGRQVGEVSRCRGRMEMVPTGVRGEPYSVVKAAS